MRGEPVTGFGIYERSLVLYRDWELVDVLAASAGDSPEIAELAEKIRPLIAAGSRSEARDPVAATRSALPASCTAHCREVIDALAEALSVDA
jgi:hypothetical protein